MLTSGWTGAHAPLGIGAPAAVCVLKLTLPAGLPACIAPCCYLSRPSCFVRAPSVGRAGFCTGEDDGLAVVRAYVEAKPRGNPLARFLPVLQKIRQQGGGDSPLLAGASQAQLIQASEGRWMMGTLFFAARPRAGLCSPDPSLWQQCGE